MKPTPWTAQEYQTNLLRPVAKVVSHMERRGVPVDRAVLTQINEDMSRRAGELRADLKVWTGSRDVNWNSWQQLAEWLHGDTGLGLDPSPYCKKGEVPDGEIKTDDRALEWVAGQSEEHRGHIQNLRLLRQCERMARYARDWLQAGIQANDGTFRLHPSFGLASDNDTRPGAVTGRFGVKNPPLNQVPRNKSKDPAGMRRAFVAPPGYRMIVVDYSQLEIVILSHLIATLFGDDDPMVQAVRGNKDIHTRGAKFIFGELAGNKKIAEAEDALFKTDPDLSLVRDLTKSGIYGKNYCKGVKGFATSVFLPNGEPLGMERANLLVTGLDTTYPGVPRFQAYVRDFIERWAYIVSLLGRWQPMPLARDQKMGNRNRAWRQSCNYGMQAGGQEIMALAIMLIEADEELRDMGYELGLVVHDETVGWAPEKHAETALAKVESHMVGALELLAPLRAKGHTGINWAEAK